MTKAKISLKEFNPAGGRQRFPAKVELFEKTDGKIERITAMGRKVRARSYWHNRMGLTGMQRHAGIVYASAVEIVACGGGGREFLREFVDGGAMGSGGPSAQYERAGQLKDSAVKWMHGRRLIKYKPYQSEDKARVGAHRPIRPLDLLNHIMVDGMTIDDVAGIYRWTRLTKDGVIVPRPQKDRIMNGVRQSLDLLIDGWADARLNIGLPDVET